MKNADWRAYRELKPLAQKPEGCTMSDPKTQNAAAAQDSPRDRYERLLADLAKSIDAYRHARGEAKKHWAAAELSASHARDYSRQAGEALQETVVTLKKVRGVDDTNALMAIGRLDIDAGRAWTDTLVRPDQDELEGGWDPDDQVTLAELQEEDTGNGD